MDSSKKTAAAMAAVMTYIRQGEEASAMQVQATAASRQDAAAAISESLNIWGSSGRQSIMQTRTLMQMKSFHGIK